MATQNAPSFHVAIGRGKALQLNVDGPDAMGPTSVANVDNTGAAVRVCTGSNLGAAVWMPRSSP